MSLQKHCVCVCMCVCVGGGCERELWINETDLVSSQKDCVCVYVCVCVGGGGGGGERESCGLMRLTL